MLSYIRVDAEALKSNLSTIRSFLNDKEESGGVFPSNLNRIDKKIISVVKANAYGVGETQVINTIDEFTDAFAVNNINELVRARHITDKDIYLLGYVSPTDVKKAILARGIFTVYSRGYATKLNAIAEGLNETVYVNIKIDALLGRQGLLVEELKIFLDHIGTLDRLIIRGIYAHFSNLEDTVELTHAENQINAYKTALEIAKNCLKPEIWNSIETHISSTAGVLVYDKGETFHTHVRLGIGLYGLWPSKSVRERFENSKKSVILKPVICWVTHIAQIKEIPKNYPIGYGMTYKTSKKSKIAVIPQGYSDGYDRKLSNKGEVLIHGERCKVIGRIAMNMFVVDVSHIKDVEEDDEVVLLGRQEFKSNNKLIVDEITAEELAEHCDTINYEIIARINPLLKRIVKK